MQLKFDKRGLTDKTRHILFKDALFRCAVFKRTLLNHGVLVDGLDDMVVFVVVVTQKRDRFIP